MTKKLRCQGHCCRKFFIEDNLTYEQLWQQFSLWQKDPEKVDEDEIYLMAPMLIPVGTSKGKKQLYTCKHLKNGKNCSIYPFRPKMCRDLGEKDPCYIPSCGLNPKNSTPIKKLFRWFTIKRFVGFG